MHRAGRPPSRIRQASASADADTATLHTEHSAEQADRTGVDLPIISLSQIRRLDVGRITLSDVVSYAQPGGAVAERVRDAGSTEDHIHVAHDDTPPSREEGLFRRRRGPEAAARRQTARQRRALSAPVAERQVVSAYLSTVPGRRDSTTHEPSVVPGLATASSAGVLQAGSRQERVDAHNAWLLRKEGERGNTWKILELLQAGVPARSADEGGRTACHFAGMNNHSKAIIALANPHQNAYIPHNFEDAAGDGATALHYAAFNGCIEAAKTILKMHRGQIQAERFKRRDADAARLGENQVELRRNEQQLTALRARMEELEEKEFELTSRIETLNDQMTQEDERFKLENDDLRYKQKQAEETLEVHAQQTEKLEQTVAHWKPISRIKYEAFNTEWEAAKIELSKLEMALIDAVSGVEDATKAHGKTKRKLSRQLLQAQQSLEATKEKLHDKTEAETKMSALNTQLKEENQTLRLSVAEFSRKVVHVCKGPHHIEFNAEIHKRAADGSTPLHWAVDSGQDDMCHLLLECGADANAKDAQGLTPLHWGAIASAHDSSIPEPKVGLCYLQACQELLAKGGKCNAVDSLGCAPLHYAAQSGFTQLIQVLKEWGGDASLQNNAGANPLHYAMAQQSPDLEVALALVAGIKDIYSAIHIQDKNGMSPMHYANALGHPQMASQLAVHCNALQLAQSEESIRQARMGLRDATHMQLSQLVGAHVITGSTSEHERYYTNDLAPTRNKGWSRNDLIHQLRPQPAASSNQKLRSADLFQSLSLSLTRIATQDDSDFLALSFEPTNSIGDEGERHTNASAVAPRTTTR